MKELKVLNYPLLFACGLTAKVVSGLGVWLLYVHYYQEGDMLVYMAESSRLLSQYSNDPFHIFRNHAFWQDHTSFANQPRAIFFLKLIIMLKAFLVKDYLVSLALSILSFAGSFYLFRTLTIYYSSIQFVAGFVLLFLPSYIFWTSGILKESLANATICYLIATSIQASKGKFKIHAIPVVLLAGWLLLQIKYYLFGALIPMLLTYIFFSKINSGNRTEKESAVLLFTAIWFAGGLIAMQFHSYLNPLLWGEIITESDQGLMPASSGNFEWRLALGLVPQAIVSAWYSPMVWEAKNTLHLTASLQSTLLLVISIAALILNMNPGKWKLEAWLVIVYSMGIGVLLGLSISNFGSLIRYRTSFLPLLSILVIAAVPQIKSLIRTIFEKIFCKANG